jgi:hypothetical protein
MKKKGEGKKVRQRKMSQGEARQCKARQEEERRLGRQAGRQQRRKRIT